MNLDEMLRVNIYRDMDELINFWVLKIKNKMRTLQKQLQLLGFA